MTKPARPHCHYSQTSGEIRVYADADGNAQRADYVRIVSVTWTKSDTAMLHGGLGDMRHNTILAIAQTLVNEGAENVIVSRSKNHKMPFGEAIENGEHETTYLVRLGALIKRGLIEPKAKP